MNDTHVEFNLKCQNVGKHKPERTEHNVIFQNEKRHADNCKSIIKTHRKIPANVCRSGLGQYSPLIHIQITRHQIPSSPEIQCNSCRSHHHKALKHHKENIANKRNTQAKARIALGQQSDGTTLPLALQIRTTHKNKNHTQQRVCFDAFCSITGDDTVSQNKTTVENLKLSKTLIQKNRHRQT